MSAHEIAEHIEHAAHGGDHRGPARYIGADDEDTAELKEPSAKPSEPAEH